MAKILEIVSSVNLSNPELQFMPVMANKRPLHQGWQENRVQYNFDNAEAVGLVCGSISGNVEVLDIDLKYDITGSLMHDLCKEIDEICPGLRDKFVVQKTMSGGYHFVYKCSVIEGNRKLASRPATEDEKRATFSLNLPKFREQFVSENHQNYPNNPDGLNLDAEAYAEKMARAKYDGDKVRVLLETRGDKGYIACYPTPGYDLVKGDFSSIQSITPSERQRLFEICYSFNSYIDKIKSDDRKSKFSPKKETRGKTPLEDYNDRGDVISLLIEHGWAEVRKRGNKIHMKRPGVTSAETSGNFDEEMSLFSVFSTSTEFEPNTGYSPCAVYAKLVHNDDFSATAKDLYEKGFGDRQEVMRNAAVSVPSVIDMTDTEDLSFLAGPQDFDDYLRRWRLDQFDRGKTTGMPELDKHFLFKEGNLVIVNGIDNVGKSTVIWYLEFLAAIYHGWHWLVFSSENKSGSVMRKMIEFYWGIPLQKMNDKQYSIAYSFVSKHFKIIKVSDSMYNYMDILNMTKKVMKKQKVHGLMIDPYNSLKVERNAKSKQETYEYHYEVASELKLFGTNHNLCIYLNAHVGTGAARKKDKSDFTVAPGKEDTEMGVMFANKADEFLTIHRNVDHETDFLLTELHVRKVKEIETGGQVTPKYRPVMLRPLPGVTGFMSVNDKSHIHGTDPVKSWRDVGAPKQASVFDEKFSDIVKSEPIQPPF